MSYENLLNLALSALFLVSMISYHFFRMRRLEKKSEERRRAYEKLHTSLSAAELEWKSADVNLSEIAREREEQIANIKRLRSGLHSEMHSIEYESDLKDIIVRLENARVRWLRSKTRLDFELSQSLQWLKQNDHDFLKYMETKETSCK
jgi:hypothetical protein